MKTKTKNSNCVCSEIIVALQRAQKLRINL